MPIVTLINPEFRAPRGKPVRIFNPPSKKKVPWTYGQAEARKAQAERFTREILGDDDRADEIAAMSPPEYASQRGKEVNPQLGGTMKNKVSTHEEARDNPVALATRALNRQQELYEQLDNVRCEKQELLNKLSAIRDVIECDDPECTREDHDEAVRKVLDGVDEGED